MRKLASIQRIRKIEPIPGADAIVKATVLGWQVVVKPEEFTEGDLCVYVEIDSVLPEKPAFEFLRNRAFRIRTIKLRGQLSQGICFPVSILPPGVAVEEGADVTKALGIVKYEAPVPPSLAGVMKGAFPSFVPKTDEDRVQVVEDLLKKHKGRLCYVTEKLDGTSVTFYLKNGQFGVCSRNMELVEGENLYWKAARALDVENKLRRLGKNLALQGELVGEGIQGNKLKLKGRTVYFFSLFWIDSFRYANFQELKETVEAAGLQMVPVVSTCYELDNDVQAILAMAQVQSTIREGAMAEGLVIRAMDAGEHVSFKSINNNFLLKWEE